MPPPLVRLLLTHSYSSDETIKLVLQTLLTLVSREEGAKEFVAIDDVSALVEIAPSQPLALDILLYAYSQSATFTEDAASMRSKIDKIIQSLIASFKGTDAVTLLAFLAELLRRIDPQVRGHSRNLVSVLATDSSIVPNSRPVLAKDRYWFHPQSCD